MDKAKFAAFVRAKAAENFAAYGYLTPVALALQRNRLAVLPLSGLSKDETARQLQRLRSSSALVAMVTEAWLVDLGKATPAEREQALSMAPSEHPKRKEVAFVTVYYGLTMVVHTADIIRTEGSKKPRLGPWRAMPMTEAQGRYADPPPEWN